MLVRSSGLLSEKTLKGEAELGDLFRISGAAIGGG